MTLRLMILALLALSACVGFPEVDAASRGLADLPAPELVPLAGLLEAAPSEAEARGAALAAEAAALKARGALLRSD